MKVATRPFEKMKTAELAEEVAKLAAAHNFIPPAFQFELVEDEAVTTDDNAEDADIDLSDDQDVDTFDEEEVGDDDEVPA
ncbi:MAG: hypothetical protein NVV72_01240 [Asticcacaulis sp.]|nr:hypothetical protein [Asticcacaulis sp.]